MVQKLNVFGKPTEQSCTLCNYFSTILKNFVNKNINPLSVTTSLVSVCDTLSETPVVKMQVTILYIIISKLIKNSVFTSLKIMDHKS